MNNDISARFLTRFIARATAVSLWMLSLLGAGGLQATTAYWDGTAGSWNTVAGWSTDPSAPTPDPASVPGSGDTAFFTVTGVTGLQSVTLDAPQAVTKLSLLSSASGGLRLLGGGTDRVLSLGSGGIEIANGAGPLTLGSSVSGQGVPIALTANQTWTNGSSSPLTVHNAIGAAGAQTLTLRGPGGFRLNGTNTFSGGVTLASSTAGIGNNAALGTGVLNANTGTILVEDFPRTIANKVKINNATTFWSGDGALTLTGSGATPSFAITQNAGPTINMVNSAPMKITGIYSLCDANSPNNNPQSPTLASSANLTISAEIWESNAGNTYNVNNKGAKFVFTGAGANLTLTGTNLFGEGASIGRSTEIVVQPGSGFNTITIGGPGGPGAAITPFGLSAFYSNSGQGFYLKALESGQILSNNVVLGGSTGNDGGRPLGFAGENNLTFGGSLSSSAILDSAFPNIATGTLTLAGAISQGAWTFLFLGPGSTVFASTSTHSSTGGAIGKRGPGKLTFAGSSTSSGPLRLYGGTAVLDYVESNASRIPAGTNAAAALVLGGVDLQLKGGSYAQTLGSGGGTTLDVGYSRVRRTDGGTSTFALGSITRNSGGLADFEGGVASTTTGNTSGILGAGYATVGGADWATVSGGSIVAYASYGTFAVPGTDQNVAHTGNATLGSTSIKTLKLATSGPGESLSLTNGNLSLNNGGLLFVGADDYAISGSVNSSIVYSGGLCAHHYGNGVLTINSRLSGGFVQKAGPGKLALACVTNSYTTMTYLLGGTLSVHADGCLGSGPLSFNGGTLQTTASFSTTKNVTLNANGGTFQVDAGTLEVSGIVSGTYGALNKTGLGTLLLSSNTFAGPVTVSEGTLKFGHVMALGPLNNASAASNRGVSPVTVTGTSVLDIAGFSPSIGNFTLVSGTVTDSVGAGSLAAYSFSLESGTVEAVLTNVVVPYASNPSNRSNLYKRGAGEAVIASTCTYSGHTFVDGGTLRVNGALPNSPALVRAGGTLGGTGALALTVNVEGGTLAPGASASVPGTLTLGRHLRLDSGAILSIGIGSAGSGKIVLSNPDAKVLLANASLSLTSLPGVVSAVTIIDNQGANAVQGTFSGLPEGAVFTAGGRRFAITYAGGDGNDVVLTFKPTATFIFFN